MHFHELIKLDVTFILIFMILLMSIVWCKITWHQKLHLTTKDRKILTCTSWSFINCFLIKDKTKCNYCTLQTRGITFVPTHIHTQICYTHTQIYMHTTHNIYTTHVHYITHNTYTTLHTTQEHACIINR